MYRNSLPLLIIEFALALAACSTQKVERTPQNSGPTYVPRSWEATGNPVLSTVVGIMAIAQLSKYEPANKTRPFIDGRCEALLVKSESGEMTKVCQSTYILFTNPTTQHATKVWVDEKGRFSFSCQPRNSFEVQAVNDDTKFKSKKLRVHCPQNIRLQIHNLKIVKRHKPLRPQSESYTTNRSNSVF